MRSTSSAASSALGPPRMLAQPAGARRSRPLPVDDVPAQHLVLALLFSAGLWAGIVGIAVALFG